MNHILISRTDAIGDVVLTLPMAGYLKELYPHVKISFLGKSYTGPVVRCCKFVDEFIDHTLLLEQDDMEQVRLIRDKRIDAIIHVFPNRHIASLGKRAGVKIRIGTKNRVYHWLTCNKLVKLSRRNSGLHEAQLNLMLLKPIGLADIPLLHAIIDRSSFVPAINLPAYLQQLIATDKFNLVLHPGSNGSGAEWGLAKFKILSETLPPARFKIFITGSANEKLLLQPWLETLPEHVIDVTGQMTLDELIAFIKEADGLLASGTGPLHLAAALGVHTLGLFPSLRPIHPGRWAPLGKKVHVIESGGDNLDNITVNEVADMINNWI